MVCIRVTIPSKVLEKHSYPNDIECLFIKRNFRKCKLHYSQCIIRHLKINKYYSNYLDKTLDT